MRFGYRREKPKRFHFSDSTEYLWDSIEQHRKFNMGKIKGKIVVDAERCKGCGVCIEACPTQTISLNPQVNSKGYNYCYMSNPDSCIGCAGCAIVCPDSCIVVYREKKQA